LAHKSQAKDDVRVRRSHQRVRQAVFDLTVEKGFAAVTVSDIAARAQVNRSTFYRHFLDKHDVVRRYLDEVQVLAARRAAAQVGQPRPGAEHIPAGLLALLQEIQERARFFKVMLGKQGDPAFAHRFRHITEKRYRLLFAAGGQQAASSSLPVDLRVAYIAHATLGALLWWLENGQPISVEQLAIDLGRLNLTAAGTVMSPTGPSQR